MGCVHGDDMDWKEETLEAMANLTNFIAWSKDPLGLRGCVSRLNTL